MGLEEHIPKHVVATNRATALLLLAISIIVIALLVGTTAIYAGIALLILIAIMRGYASIATLAAVRLRVEPVVKGRLEGEPLEVLFTISNDTIVPIALIELSVAYSPHLRLAEGSRAGVAVIPPKGSIGYRLVFTSRAGKHLIGPVVAVVRDPLGLYRSSELELGKPVEVRISPKPVEVVIRKLFVKTRSTGITRSREPGSGIEFHSIREYRPGDEIKRIDWKHYASKRKLAIREMEREAYQSILFVLDATPPMFFGAYGLTPFEHSARIIASIASYLARRGDLMSIVVYGRDYASISGPMARGKQGYYKVLLSLSSVEFDTREINDDVRSLAVERALKKVAEILPRERNLVFMFTTAGTARYLEALVDISTKLSALGNVVYAIIPVSTAYEIKGLTGWAQAVYRVKTFERMKMELDFARRLRRYGVRTLALGPQHLPQTVIAIVESMRA